MSSRIEFRVSPEFKSQIESKAQELGKTVSDLVREALELYLKLAENEIPVELIKQAMKQPSEAKYLLEIEWWYRQGPAYVDEQRYEIVYGDVDALTIDEWAETYPYRKGGVDIVVPRTVPVIIRLVRRDDTVDPPIHEEWLYIFTKDGWKAVRVR